MECARYPRPPVLGYLLLAATWLLAIEGLELVDRVRALDLLGLVVLGLATHQISRVLTKERIAYPLRRLFTEPDGDTPRAGWAMAPGQLVTCPYCASVWSATFLVAVQIIALNTVLALAGAASLAHAWRDRDA